MNKKIVIGTRGSALALWQARYTQNLLAQIGIESELKTIVTSGDKNQQWENSFDKLEGKNFFTKEIEEALLKKEIDLAVHSFKDVEANFDNSDSPLIIAGLSKRHTPNDILIIHKDKVDKQQLLHLVQNAKVGTSSARRYAQLKSLRPDVEIFPLRGNVPTRIQKLQNRQYDGIILAQAGIDRLQIDLNDFYIFPLPLHYFVPAAGQGIIAFQIRSEDKRLLEYIQNISDEDANECGKIERKLLKQMGGGCSKPIGVLCEKRNEKWRCYISFNDNKENLSLLSIIEHSDSEHLLQTAQRQIEKLQSLFQTPINKNIFISKSLDENNYLKKLCQRLHWKLTDISLIQTNSVSVSSIPDCDWIFFSSKNAVKYFLNSLSDAKELANNKHIACIGKSTAYFLESQGFSVHYYGSDTNLENIANEFSKHCKNQRVLFPCSTISNQSIGNLIQEIAEVNYLPVYSTMELNITLSESFDVLIFTSPSNVRAFFKSNNVSLQARYIAMGESTKKELLQHNIPDSHIEVPIAFDDVAIAGALLSVVE
ncbi:MAG: hypothetical protein KatS3mg027_0752 [Bacteroidia bacterium]|nr:MAG: hypothetical protein KatS3mg027_0752 [Bacteroidia bacterium]